MLRTECSKVVKGKNLWQIDSKHWFRMSICIINCLDLSYNIFCLTIILQWPQNTSIINILYFKKLSSRRQGKILLLTPPQHGVPELSPVPIVTNKTIIKELCHKAECFLCIKQKDFCEFCVISLLQCICLKNSCNTVAYNRCFIRRIETSTASQTVSDL